MGERCKIASVVAMASVLVVSAAGCGGTVTKPAGQEPAASSAAPPASAPVRRLVPSEIISVRIRDGKATGAPDRVEVNRLTRVRIEVTSDRSDEVHVHGYDKEVELSPGKPGAVEFVADVPGVFEVETHNSGLLLFQLVVR